MQGEIKDEDVEEDDPQEVRADIEKEVHAPKLKKNLHALIIANPTTRTLIQILLALSYA